jgi:hypothetical protein
MTAARSHLTHHRWQAELFQKMEIYRQAPAPQTRSCLAKQDTTSMWQAELSKIKGLQVARQS